ncbi:hypothetical protein SNE40_002462 [Patella caerulea]|uniref:Uncharacterized protein n=2 Tax=Patella caerulea TaxID=87958 RepID=A0AAN8K155_PATCE
MQGQVHNSYGDLKMIKHNSVQNSLPSTDISMNQLPPLSMLPQWTRVNTLDKARYPKPFIKDRLQPLPPNKGDGEEGDSEFNMNPAQRSSYLERSIKFLKQQHQDILKCLHEEIDTVKKENKELQFKLIMNQKRKKSAKKSDKQDTTEDAANEDDTASIDSKYLEGTDKSREVRVIFLNEEIKELKRALRETTNTNTYLKQLVEKNEEEVKRQQITIENLKSQTNQEGPETSYMVEQLAASEKIFSQKSTQQLTQSEYQGIIRHLQQVNEKQSHELESLKSDLRDVLYSHKWTPDAYLLAKAYVAEDDSKDSKTSKSALPRIPLKHPTRKLPDLAYVQRDNVSLPALKHTVSNKATERQKRTQVIQKARLREELYK